MEFGLSTIIGLKISGEKNIGSDLIAAIVMVVIGTAYETVGFNILRPAQKIQELGVANPSESLELGRDLVSFGETIQTTMGMNAVLAALVFYAVIKITFLIIMSRLK